MKSCTPKFSEYILYAVLYVCMSIYLLYILIYIYNDILCNCAFNISRPRSPCDLATCVPNAPKHCALRWRWKRRRRRCLGQHGERHVRGAPRRCLVKHLWNGWLFRLVRRLHDQWFLCVYIYIYYVYSFVGLFVAFSSLKTGDQVMFRPDLSVPPNKYYTLLNHESLVSKTAPQKKCDPTFE